MRWVRFDQCADNFFNQKVKIYIEYQEKIFWVRFDQKAVYVLVDWVRFDQKGGYVLTKTGYVLVGYVLAWVRFDLHPNPLSTLNLKKMSRLYIFI